MYIYIYTNPEEHLTWLCGVKTPCSEEERTLEITREQTREDMSHEKRSWNKATIQ